MKQYINIYVMRDLVQNARVKYLLSNSMIPKLQISAPEYPHDLTNFPQYICHTHALNISDFQTQTHHEWPLPLTEMRRLDKFWTKIYQSFKIDSIHRSNPSNMMSTHKTAIRNLNYETTMNSFLGNSGLRRNFGTLNGTTERQEQFQPQDLYFNLRLSRHFT